MIPFAISLLFILVSIVLFPWSFTLLASSLCITFISLCLFAWRFPKHRIVCLLINSAICLGSLLSIPALLSYQTAQRNVPHHDTYQFIVTKTFPSSQSVHATLVSPETVKSYTLRIYAENYFNELSLGETYETQLSIQPNRFRPSFHSVNPQFTQLANAQIGRSTLKKAPIALAPPSLITSLRTNIEHTLSDNSFKNSALMSALSVGLTDHVDQKTWELFRHTGTIHLISISGLHLTFLALWCFAILKTLLGLCLLQKPAPYQVAAIISLIIALSYALLAGMSIPTQRALIMFAIFGVALLARYPILSLQSLATALVIILILTPFSVVTIGFWLSFTAVLILLLLTRYKFSFITSLLLTQIIISVLAIPFVASFFNEASLISPLANLFAIPWMTLFTLPSLLIGLILLPIAHDAGLFLLTLSDQTLTVLLNFLQVMNDIPMSYISLPHIPFVTAILLTALSIIMLIKLRRSFKILNSLAITGIIICLSTPTQEDYLLVMPVGEGLSTLLHTQQQTLLFDTGPYFRGYDSAESIIVPTLKNLNIHQLNTIILSHDNQQHVGGTRTLRRAFSEANIVTHPSLHNLITDSILCQTYSFTSPNLMIDALPTHKSCGFKVTINNAVIWLIANISPSEWQYLTRNNNAPDIVLFPNKGRSKGYVIPDHWKNVILIGSTQMIHADNRRHNLHNAYYGALRINLSEPELIIESANDTRRFWWSRPSISI